MIITAEYLAQYTYLESALKRIERRLKHFNDNPLKTEHGVVKSTRKDFTYAQCHLVISGTKIKSESKRHIITSQIEIDLMGNYQLYTDMKLDIERFIETVKDLEIKDILSKRYMDNLTYEEIGRDLGYDRTTISKKVDKFLNQQQVSHNSHT